MDKETQDHKMSIAQKTSIFAESKKRAQATLKKGPKESLLQGLKDELRKVAWTSKEELKICTKIVVGSTFMFGLGIYGVDLVVKGFLEAIHMITRLVFGA
jgi:preprotein translocase subunit SecE